MYDMNLPNVPIEPPLEAPDSHAGCATRDFAAGNRLYRARLALIGIIGAVVLAAIAQLSALAGNRQNLPIPSEKKFYLCLLNARVAVMVVGILGLVFVGLYLLVRRTRPDLWQKTAVYAWYAVLAAGVCGELLIDEWCYESFRSDIFFETFLPLAMLWTLGGLYRKGMYLHEKSVARLWGRYIGGVLLRTLLLILGMVAVAVVGIIVYFCRTYISDLWKELGELILFFIDIIDPLLSTQSGLWSPAYLVVAPVFYIAVALVEKCDFERRKKSLPDRLFAPVDGGVYAVASMCAVAATVFSLVNTQYQYSSMGVLSKISTFTVSAQMAGTLSGLLLILLYARLLGLAQTVHALHAPVRGLRGMEYLLLFAGFVRGCLLGYFITPYQSITAYTHALQWFSYLNFGLHLLSVVAVAWLVFVLVRKLGAPHSLWAVPVLHAARYVVPVLGNLLLRHFLEAEKVYVVYSICNIFSLVLVPVVDLILFSRCRRPAVPPAGETLASEMPASEMFASEHKIPTELG